MFLDSFLLLNHLDVYYLLNQFYIFKNCKGMVSPTFIEPWVGDVTWILPLQPGPASGSRISIFTTRLAISTEPGAILRNPTRQIAYPGEPGDILVSIIEVTTWRAQKTWHQSVILWVLHGRARILPGVWRQEQLQSSCCDRPNPPAPVPRSPSKSVQLLAPQARLRF